MTSVSSFQKRSGTVCLQLFDKLPYWNDFDKRPWLSDKMWSGYPSENKAELCTFRYQ